mgnify:CR=1 FL=1
MKVLYPGSFDPVTYGHLDIINRCAAIVRPIKKGVREWHGVIFHWFSPHECLIQYQTREK